MHVLIYCVDVSDVQQAFYSVNSLITVLYLIYLEIVAGDTILLMYFHDKYLFRYLYFLPDMHVSHSGNELISFISCACSIQCLGKSFYYVICLRLFVLYRASGQGTAHPSGAPEFTPGYQWGSCYSIFSFICMFCRSLFVLLYFYQWPLCCLLFDIRSLVSSNSSFRQKCNL